MVEVGTLQIKGMLDTSNIVRGQRQISSGFATMKQKTQSTFGSMNLLAGSTKALGSALQNVGTTAAGGLTLLAGLAATLAPNFAKIKVETFKLAQILGNEMKPAMDAATDAYSKFVNFIGQDTALANFTKDTLLLVGAGGALSLLSSKLFGISKLGKIFIPIAILLSLEKNKEELSSYVESKTGSEFLGDIVGAGLSGIAGGGIAALGTKLISKIPGAGKLGGAAGGIGTAVGAASFLDDLGQSKNEYLRNLALGAAGGGTVGFGLGGPLGAGAGAIVGAGGAILYTGSNDIYNMIKENFFNDVDSSGR